MLDQIQFYWWCVLTEGMVTTGIYVMMLYVYIYTWVYASVNESSSVLADVFFPHKNSSLFFFLACCSDWLQHSYAFLQTRLRARCRFTKFFGSYNWHHACVVGTCNLGTFIFFFLVTILKAMKLSKMANFGDNDIVY